MKARLFPVALLLVVSSCSRAVRPLRGTAAPAAFPPVVLPNKPMQLEFTWVYGDDQFSANGDGVVRVKPPDQARLDFFLKNGNAGGFALLDGDSLTVPGADVAQRLMPPPSMLWAALNRLALPVTRDTVARQDGDTLRVDLGSFTGADASAAEGPAWRLTFAGVRLVRVDRIDKGRIIETVSRERATTGETIRYFHETAHRRLTIVLGDTTWVEGFNESIWRRR